MTRYMLPRVAALGLGGFVIVSRDTTGLYQKSSRGKHVRLRDETVSSALREAVCAHSTENRVQFASFRQTHSYIQFLTLLATAELQRINARSLMSAEVSVSFACIA